MWKLPSPTWPTMGAVMPEARMSSFAPTMASAANIAAFNLGNTIGVMIGGWALAAGLGWVSPVWTGAAFSALGAVLVLGSSRKDR